MSTRDGKAGAHYSRMAWTAARSTRECCRAVATLAGPRCVCILAGSPRRLYLECKTKLRIFFGGAVGMYVYPEIMERCSRYRRDKVSTE